MAAKPVLIPRLVIIEGKDKGKVITLTDGTAVIGRSKADLLIQDARISRSHVAVHFNSVTNKLTFTDLKSLNGTELNGVACESGDLNDGDRLQIGNTVFDIQISVASDELTSTSEILARSRQRNFAKPPSPNEPKLSHPAPNLNDAKGLKSLDSRVEEPSSDLLPMENADALLSKEPKPGPSGIKTELKPKRQKPSIQILKTLYQNLPRKTQRSLWVILALMVGIALWPTANEESKLDSEIEKEISEIKQVEKIGLLDEAITRANALTQKYPNRSEGFLILGSLQMNQNQLSQAIETLNRAHRLPPELPVTHVKLVRLYLKSQRAAEAAEELRHVERVMAEKKFNRDFFIEQAQLYLEFKDLQYSSERALILAKGLQKEFAPESSIGYKLEAQVHFKANRPQEALTAMEKGRVVDPQDEWLIENAMFAKLSMKDFTGAETLLDEWLKVRPSATKALLVFGYLRYHEKNYAKAIPYVQKILQLANATPGDPFYPEALNLMGQIYQQLEQPLEAQNFYRQGCTAGFQQSCEQPLLKAEATAGKTNTETVQVPPSESPLMPQDETQKAGSPENFPAPASIPSPESIPSSANIPSPARIPSPASIPTPSNSPSALEQIAPPPSNSP